MPKGKGLIEPIDATFDDVVNRIFARPRANALKGGTVQKELIWAKKLSVTDAQRETRGGKVPYLRLTRGSDKNVDYQSWFRSEFFVDQNWQAGMFGKEEDLETCKVIISVKFGGVSLGDLVFQATHGPNRWESNNAPNTWLHWPSSLLDLLEKNDMSQKQVILTRQENGSFSMMLGD
jgi:hypothetical protein